jgi:membrane-bound lytic murein transglycosylase A
MTVLWSLFKKLEANMVVNKRNYRVLILTVCSLLLTSCSDSKYGSTTCTHKKRRAVKTTSHEDPRIINFEPVPFSHLEQWENDDHVAALEVFTRSCTKILTQHPESAMSPYSDIGGKAKEWHDACRALPPGKRVSRTQARQFFEKWFVPYKVVNHASSCEGIVTGYYEIELNGSLNRTSRFRYPVYKKPPNLEAARGKGWLSHASINNGSLKGKKLELLYVDSLARLFSMHTQGSGVVKLPNGKEVRLGFDGSNGFSFRSIYPTFEKYRKKVDSKLPLMEWLEKNPKLGKKVMEQNPSYVFFKIKNGSPVGAQGVPLKAERSIAVDNKLFPYGVPVWIETNLPKTPKLPARKFHHLVVAQDTGGAIRGAIRVDVFFGRGKKAEDLAQRMKEQGAIYALFPKSVAVPEKYWAYK